MAGHGPATGAFHWVATAAVDLIYNLLTGATLKLPSKPAVIRIFKVLAVAEAFSWAALLLGMFFKWVLRITELGVEIAGPIHGALFIGYGIAALLLWKLQRWPFGVAFLAGLSAVFPFATLLFERWAARRGFLTTASVPSAAVPSAAVDERQGAEV